jgi:phosphoribosylglycinamide formyltransferase 1
MNPYPQYKLAVLLSGRGSNFSAIQKAIEGGEIPNTTIAIVISNHPEAGGLALAQAKGLQTAVLEKQNYANRLAFDEALVSILQTHQVDLLVLAGYDRIISKPLLETYPGRILNIHPSLLPAYGGKGMLGIKVHQAVIANQEKESGCSVHIVTDIVDGGTILGKSAVPVLATDSPETLAARILEKEHQLYPRVIREFIEQHFAQEGESDFYECNTMV